MITLRNANDRGHANFGWLDSRHTFSFGNYHDPRHMGFGPLRVINDDRVAGGGGFPTHPHADMEIISYVLDGALAHKDSLGTGSIIRPGEIQMMSAGRGIRHSEFNASDTEAVHFLQIWILPSARGLAPSYEQKPVGDIDGRLKLIGSNAAGDDHVQLNQDVHLFAGRLKSGDAVEHSFAPGRIGWVQVARGTLTLRGQRLGAGDGAAIENEAHISLVASEDAELLLFDMAA